MIIENNPEKIVDNIKAAAEDRDFYRKVEVDDPNLSKEEHGALLSRYLRGQDSFGVTILNYIARACVRLFTSVINIHTKIEGLDQLKEIYGGAVITSNHFSPLDNLVVRHMVYHAFHQKMYVVSQDTNLAMTGFLGFFMNYSDIIPLWEDIKYVSEYFGPTIKDLLHENNKILIYPEQEMWFHYRKPRPPKRGPYYYASENSVPVISCFVEIQDMLRKERQKAFYQTKYVMHVLPTIYPDPDMSVKENSTWMMKQDYEQKKEAYEKAYGMPLTYDFEERDIAGWAPGVEKYGKKRGQQ